MTTFDLFSSVRDGNTEIVRRLLQSKQCRARLNDRNEWGDTALHLAAEAGNAEICQMLIAAGASITVRNNRGETCLHRAAVGGHVEAVRAIVGRDQDPEAVNSQNDAGYTALHHAAKHGSKDLIEILVKADADRMIENNAGEAPYMVAHKFQQWEAERLLLNVEQQHADRAMREMNRKEKDIIRAYMKAVKQASHLESRVRIMLVGDRGTGKTSLKKTLFGEAYNLAEKPSSGVHADPSITRIQFKQYREWVLPVASKSDTHRLNLEYIDIIIDYVLRVLQQPRVSDDSVDTTSLQIKKEQVKTVNFNSKPDFIPDSDVPSEETEEEVEGEGVEVEVEGEEEKGDGGEGGDGQGAEGGELSKGDDSGGEEGVPRGEAVSSSAVEAHDRAGVSSLSDREAEEQRGSDRQSETGELRESPEGSMSPEQTVGGSTGDSDGDSDVSPIGPRAGMHSPTLVRRVDHLQQSNPQGDHAPTDGANYKDDRLSRFAHEFASTEPSSDAYSSSSISTTGTSTTTSTPERSQSTSSDSLQGTSLETSHQPPSLVSSTDAALRSRSASKGTSFQPLFFHQSRGELSRLLIEKIPREILKRMVIRWPVGEETPRDRTEFNRKRLMITVWDVSGDTIQQNFTPFFFSDRCLYVAAYNLARRLDSPCDSVSAKGLKNVDDSMPTNAEVLEDWLGCVTAFSKDVPMQQCRCTKQTPVLPPVIFACTHADNASVREAPFFFHQFFDRKSFDSYKRHLVESTSPTAVGVSNKYENDCQEGYSGHHLLRREIDYLARQMPYAWDNVPVQWVKFEQLIYGLQEQRKVILLYSDLEKYVTDHCKIEGPLQILPVLSHYHDVGVITFFYRHPELCNIVITRPQWLADALATMVTSTPGRWVTGEVQSAFSKLHQEGSIAKDMLQLAYRCSRMPQRYWNEMIFILNCMNLISCHPSLHSQKAVYLPAMVTQVASEPFFLPTKSDPAMLHFSTRDAAFPVALYNQVVVSCIRSCPYQPVLQHHQAHFQLSETHHLILAKHRTSISFILQEGCEQFCSHCKGTERYEGVHGCSALTHLLGEDPDYMPSDNIATLIKVAGHSDTTSRLSLGADSLRSLCPAVLQFLTKNIEFLCHCWFPGLNLELVSRHGDETVVLNQYWRHTALCGGETPSSLCMWFNS